MGRRLSHLLLQFALVTIGAVRASEPVSLTWLAKSNRVDAAFRAVPLPKVLGRISRATGWQIFVEPGTQRTVSTVFTNLPPREALNRLLGNLSFVLVPRPDAPAKLLVYRSSADAATEAVAASDDEYTLEAGPIPNELIVRLKPGAKISIDDLARKLGAKVVGRLDALNAYRLRFDSAEAAQAARDTLQLRTDVAGIEDNYRLPVTEPNQPSAQAAQRLELKPRVAGDGTTVTVGLVDTLLQPQPKEYEQFIAKRLSVVDGTFPVDNTRPMHATAMFQDILQSASGFANAGQGLGLNVLAVNVYAPAPAGQPPTTTSWDVANGVKAAWDGGASIINLSLGGDNDSPLLDDVICQVTQQGGLVFAATGNTPGKNLTYPSGGPCALGVTAVDANGQPASYANTGPQARLAGPGTTTFVFGGQTWMATGTSGATAWTSGLAAGAISAKGWTPAQAQQWLMQQDGFHP